MSKGSASSRPGDSRSKHGGGNSNQSGHAVHRADYEVDREAVNNRLVSIESTAAESAERLTKIEGILAHIQHVMHVLVNQDADEPNIDQEYHNDAALAHGNMSDKLWLK